MIKFLVLTRFKPVNLSHEVVFILLTRFKPVNHSHEVVFILTEVVHFQFDAAWRGFLGWEAEDWHHWHLYLLYCGCS